MNILDVIKRVLSFQDWKQASALPGWRSRPTRSRHSRLPFSSDRKHGAGKQEMVIEEFFDKDKRNARFAELRANGTHNISKFSTVVSGPLDDKGRVTGRNVWCVVRP